MAIGRWIIIKKKENREGKTAITGTVINSFSFFSCVCRHNNEKKWKRRWLLTGGCLSPWRSQKRKEKVMWPSLRAHLVTLFLFFVYDRQGLLFDPGQHVKKKEIVGRASLGIMIANAIAKRRSKRRLDRRLVSQELIVGLIKREKRTAHNNKLLKDTTAGPTFPSHSVGFQSSSYCWPS